MPLTSADFITRAYREGNLIPIGQTPNDAEVTETLGIYQSLVASWIGNDIGQLLQEWEAPPSPASLNPSRFPLYPQRDGFQQNVDVPVVWRNPPPNVIVLTNAGAGGTIYFPPRPPNGARMALVNIGLDFAAFPLVMSGNGRLIEGAADLTIDANPTAPIVWFYRGDQGNWVRVSDLTLTSLSPLPPQFDDFIISSLAIRRGPGYNKEPAAATVETAKHGHRLLKTTYLQTNPGATFPGAWRMQTFQAYGSPWLFGGPLGSR